MEFQYKGIPMTLERIRVTDEEVDKRMEELRKQTPRMEAVCRPAVQGDEVIVDFVGTKDGVPFEGGTAENQPVTLGAGRFIPGFEEQLIGVMPEEKRVLHVTFPAKYPVKELAGEKADFACTVRAVRSRGEYAMDDTFAKEVGHCDTIGEMRKIMAENLSEYYDARSEEELEDKLIRAAAATLDLTITED